MNPTKLDPAWHAQRGRNARVKKRERVRQKKRQRAVGILRALAGRSASPDEARARFPWETAQALAGERVPSRADQARKLYDWLGVPGTIDPNKVVDWYEKHLTDQMNPPFRAAPPQPLHQPVLKTIPNTGGIETGWATPNGRMYYSETQHHSASYYAASQANSP